MKSLLLILLFLFTSNFVAQERTNVKPENVSDPINQWMTEIATNPKMRLEMMQMMIEQTIDKPDEMRLLINRLMNNSEMKKMISEIAFTNTNNDKNFNKPNMVKRDRNIIEKKETMRKPIIKN